MQPCGSHFAMSDPGTLIQSVLTEHVQNEHGATMTTKFDNYVAKYFKTFCHISMETNIVIMLLRCVDSHHYLQLIKLAGRKSPFFWYTVKHTPSSASGGLGTAAHTLCCHTQQQGHWIVSALSHGHPRDTVCW